MIGAILFAPALCVPGTAAHRAGVFWRCLIAAPGLKVRARAASSLHALLAAAGMAPGRFQVTACTRGGRAPVSTTLERRPGASRRETTVPCSRLRTRFNEARREAPGSPPALARMAHSPTLLNEARREAPGITEDKDGKLASVPNTASMRPGAKRRDHASAGASACGEVSMLQ